MLFRLHAAAILVALFCCYSFVVPLIFSCYSPSIILLFSCYSPAILLLFSCYSCFSPALFLPLLFMHHHRNATRHGG